MNKKNTGLCVILLGTGLFYFLDPSDFMNLEWLKDNQRPLETFYRDNGLTVMAGFVALFLVIGLFLLPGATLLSVFSGALFGLPLGPLLVSLGSTLGAVLAFFVARYILGDWVEERFGERLHPIHEGLCENDIHYMLVLRLVPLFPFFLVNIAMGVSQISWKVFMVGTLLGKLPATWVYANAGSHLVSLQSLSDITSPGVLGALTLVCLQGGNIVVIVVPVSLWKTEKTGFPQGSQDLIQGTIDRLPHGHSSPSRSADRCVLF